MRTSTVLVALAVCVLVGVVRLAGTSSTAADVLGGGRAPLTATDGWVPGGETLSAFDDVPAISRLEPGLRASLQDAVREAARDGVEVRVSTGWRSAAYQQELFDRAVAEHGSAREASKDVLPPDRSAHVSGRAVDVGPTDAMSWMAQHGSDYGLCQTYANEMWHYELSVDRGGECPASRTDASAG